MDTIEVPHYGTVAEQDAVWLETCYHEAGHAVAARDLGVEVYEVVATAEGSGYTRCGDDGDMTAMCPHEVNRAQVIDAAGAVASEIALMTFAHQGSGEAARWRSHPSCGGDRALFAEHARLPGAITVAEAYHAAHRLLARRWGDVERVAFALSESGRLSGSEV